MKNLSLILALSFFYLTSLSAQMEYTSVFRSGEGRYDRAANATFWVNPIFLKPAVFFSSDDITMRINRKWWRVETPIFTSPDNLLGGSATNPLKKSAFDAFIKKSDWPNGDLIPASLKYEFIFLERIKPSADKIGML